jgi:hypothetical protein
MQSVFRDMTFVVLASNGYQVITRLFVPMLDDHVTVLGKLDEVPV